MKRKKNKKTIAIFLCMILYLSMLCSCKNNNASTIRETSVQDISTQDTSVQDTSTQDSTICNTSIMDTVTEAQDGIGGSSSGGCIHQLLDENGYVIDDSYHTISGMLSAYVGYEASDKWSNNLWDDPVIDLDKFTIVAFLNDFSITHDQLQIFNKMSGSVYYGSDYNPDVLYSGDENIINSYYSINEVRQLQYYQKIFMYILKANLKDNINNDSKLYEQYLEWINEKFYNSEERYFDFSGVENSDKIMETILSSISYDNLCYWSVWNFVTYFNVPQEEVEKAIKNAQAFAPNVSFNVDLLYSVTRDDILKMLNYDKEAVLKPDPVDIDNLFIRISNPTITDTPKDTSVQETTPIIYDTSTVDTSSETPTD